MIHHQLASRREQRCFIPKRPWGREIIVDGISFMWRVSYSGVVIRSAQGYHAVSGDELNGRRTSCDDYEFFDDPPLLQPGLVAEWIRGHLIQ